MNIEEYFSNHALDQEFLKDNFAVSWSENTITIPIYDHSGKFIYNKYRHLTGDYKFTFEKGAHPVLFCSDKISQHGSVVLSEGELDCMKLWQEGIPAVTGTSGVATFNSKLADSLRNKKVIICLDSDKAGRDSIDKYCDILQDIATEILVISLPDEFKDVCEYFHSGKTKEDFNSLIKTALTADEWKVKNAPEEFEVESLVDLKNEDLPQQAWLIDKIVPAEGFSMLAGAEATGKSFLTLSIAQTIATQELDEVYQGAEEFAPNNKWLGEFTVSKNVPVLFIDKENGRRRLQDRMRGLGMSGENIYRVKYPERFSLSNSKGDDASDFALHLSKLVKIRKIGLIIVDSFVDVMEGNENVSSDVQTFLDQFRFLFPEVAILIIHHEGKQGGTYTKNNSDLVRGSTNIMAQVSTAFRTSVVKDVKNEYKIEQTKARDSEKMDSFIVRMAVQPDPLNTNKSLVTQLSYVGKFVEAQIKRSEAIKIIKDLIPAEEDEGNILTRKQIDSECLAKGIGSETVKDAIQEMKANRILGSRKIPKGNPINPSGNAHRYFKPAIKHIGRVNSPYKDDLEDEQ